MQSNFVCNLLSQNPGRPGTNVELRPALPSPTPAPTEGGEEENSSDLFGNATPSGCIQLFLENPTAEKFFQIGTKYRVIFEIEAID